MKRICIIAFGILMTINIFSQVPSNCTAPPILQYTYEMDVIDLAFNRMYDIKSPDTAFIDIPTIYRDTVWHGLSAIFNAFSIIQRDSVFDIYCVHRSLSYYMVSYSIDVYVDTTYSWTNAWMNLNTITGYPELDSLIAKYGFTVDHVNILNWVTLHTDQTINLRAFCDSLENFEGIFLAEPNGWGGDGDCIKYNKSGNEQFFDFSIGWGDCWSGCINRYIWKFKVNYSECSVEYLGHEANLYNPTFPDPVNCYITSVNGPTNQTKNEIRLYPNPTFGKITIETTGLQAVDIYNTSGIFIQRIEGDNMLKIDLSNRASGLYFVRIITAQGMAVEKILLK